VAASDQMIYPVDLRPADRGQAGERAMLAGIRLVLARRQNDERTGQRLRQGRNVTRRQQGWQTELEELPDVAEPPDRQQQRNRLRVAPIKGYDSLRTARAGQGSGRRPGLGFRWAKPTRHAPALALGGGLCLHWQPRWSNIVASGCHPPLLH